MMPRSVMTNTLELRFPIPTYMPLFRPPLLALGRHMMHSCLSKSPLESGLAVRPNLKTNQKKSSITRQLHHQRMVWLHRLACHHLSISSLKLEEYALRLVLKPISYNHPTKRKAYNAKVKRDTLTTRIKNAQMGQIRRFFRTQKYFYSSFSKNAYSISTFLLTSGVFGSPSGVLGVVSADLMQVQWQP